MFGHVKRPTLLTIAFISCVFVSVTAFGNDSIRLGWQIPWATQGQLVMGLKNTNALELAGVQVEFIGFSYGAPLNSAALAGRVDILLTADQPAIVLLARDPSFRIAARMMYNRACIYVPRDSGTTKLSDLAGRTVMGPVGAAAERVAIAALREAGVDPATVRFGQLDMAQQAAMLRRPGGEKQWSGVDALYGFDPLPAAFEEAGQARMLDCGKIVSVVIASNEMVTRRKAELEKFLSAFALSWHYFARHPDEANAWFVRESNLDVSKGVLDRSASIEPNRFAGSISALRLDFNDEDRASLREVSRFLTQRGVITQEIDPANHIDLSALRAALARPDLASKAARLAPRN